MTYVSPGQHLLVDLWGCSNLQDLDLIRTVLRDAAEICDATVLDINLHGFGEGAGVTGVAILAESHISIHTWPETEYAAIDVFMCGKCDPSKSLPVFQAAFLPSRSVVNEYKRG